MADSRLILIVDDEESFREIFSAALQLAGFNIETAKNSDEAIQKAKALKPQLILMDVKMPGKDGIQTTLEIRKIPELKDTHIMFLTNLGGAGSGESDLDKKYAQDLGATDFIKKTEDIAAITKAVKQFFNDTRPANI